MHHEYLTLPNNMGISTNDDMLAWILMQIVHVVKMSSSQAAILFQGVSLYIDDLRVIFQTF